MSQTLSYAERRRGTLELQPASTLVLAFEGAHPLAGGAALELEGCDAVEIGRGPDRILQRPPGATSPTVQLRLADSWMSTCHARLLRQERDWVIEDLGSKNGTFVNGDRITRQLLADGDLLEVGNSFLVYRCQRQAPPAEPSAPLADALHTLNPELQAAFRDLARIAASPVPVVLLGESGTGKELTARAVHRLSRRRGELVAFNCAALAEELIESELFGHARGAYSGALEPTPGLIRRADHGTLFLDEVAELPPSAQAKLLRVLQEHEVLPLGESRPVRVDLRVLCATHQDLAALVAEGLFRQDLHARLCGYTLRLPPLRQRREDLGLLVATLLPRLAAERAARLSFSPEAGRAVFRHPWPLNVRELEQALTAALALAPTDAIDLPHLPPALRQAVPAAPPHSAQPADAELRQKLVELLARHDGNISAVARDLGKARVQVRRWCKRLAIHTEDWGKPRG